jgi:hypothetical protein
MKRKTDTEECQDLIKKFKNYCIECYKESENFLKENNTTYEAVIHNKDTDGYGEDGENNNFEAGRMYAYQDIFERLSFLEGGKEFRQKWVKENGRTKI